MKELETKKKDLLELLEKAKSYGLTNANLMHIKSYEDGFITYSYESIKYYYEIKIKTKCKLTIIETLNDILYFTDSEISFYKFSVFFKSKEIENHTFDINNYI